MERSMIQLLDVMNEVSARLDDAPSFTPARPSQTRDTLDEMQAFIALDPLLADLSKQYQDAKGARIQAQKEFGKGDGMTEMTAILEDSAWCAMQTRYMELRGNRRLMNKAHAMMDESRREEEAQMRAEKKREALKMLDQMQTLVRVREIQEEREKDNGDWWLLLMLTMNNNGTLLFRDHHPSYRFNRLAA